MRVTSKGQVTIPQNLRERIGLMPLTEVEFHLEGKRLYIQKAKQRSTRGKHLIQHISGKATVKMTTTEIMKYMREKE